jgi:3-oxoadipate enol-lactonase
VHVLGNSMGGFVALRLAARHPGLVRSAVAMGSSAEQEHSLEQFAPLVEHMQAHGTGEVIDTLMHIMFGDTTLAAADHPARDRWRQYMLALPPSIGDAAHEVIHRKRIVEELRSVSLPVLAIAGAEDHAYPPPISSENIAEATGGRHVTVEGAGHSVALERAEDVATQLEAHLAAQPAAR